MLDPQQKNQIVNTLTAGCDRQTAAGLVGTDTDAILAEMHGDEHFLYEVRRAEASAELVHTRVIREAVEDVRNWRASV